MVLEAAGVLEAVGLFESGTVLDAAGSIGPVTGAAAGAAAALDLILNATVAG